MTGKVQGHKGPHPRSFKGRASRGEWWGTMAWTTIVGAVVGTIPTFGPLLSIPFLIGGLAVTARRLHDLKQTAWLQVLPMPFYAAGIAVPAFNGATDVDAALSGPLDPISMSFLGIGAFLSLALYAWLGLFPGVNGPNCYGEADVDFRRGA